MTDTQPRGAQGPLSREQPLGREQVDEFQRARIVSAMVEVASEVGYLGAAVAPVVARAGVSRRTFYELFDGREDCFLAAFDWGVEHACRAMAEAYASQRSWRDRIRHALAELLVLLDAEPQLARVCVIEALGAGKLVLARRAEVSAELIAALDADAPRPRGAADMRLLTAEGIVGGAFSVIHAWLLEHGEHAAADGPTSTRTQDDDSDERPLIGLHGQLMALIALSYLGPAAAGEELTRPAPEPPPRVVAGGAHLDGSPAGPGIGSPSPGTGPPSRGAAPPPRGTASGRLLERLDMRLTYRTVRCLLYIGAHPGSSNREIAHGAEISDEGQASKLLTRLTRAGLVANSRPAGPGFPNRWTLTSQGEQILAAVHSR